MPNFGILPLSGTLASVSAATTSTTSAATSLPLASSYRFFYTLSGLAGTTTTAGVDCFVATSGDGGTTYYEFLHFAQGTTNGGGQQIVFRPYVGAGDTGGTSAASAAPTLGTLDGATGSTAIVINGPIDPAHMKVRWVAATGVTQFTSSVQFIAVPQDLSD